MIKTNEEYIYNVDENDKVIGKVARKEGGEKKLRRRVSRVLIFNNKGEIMLQKRASTELDYPDNWDFGVAETLIYGECYESAAIRGLLEEVNIAGISNFDIKFLFKLKFTNNKVKRWYKVFSLIYNSRISFDRDKVSDVDFVSEDVLNKMLKTEKFVPAGLETYREYKKLK